MKYTYIRPFVYILIAIVHRSTADDVLHSGRKKYDEIRSLSASSSTSTCWQEILNLLHEHCSIDQLNQYQSMIAYQFTLCHLSSMGSDLATSLLCIEENLENCVARLHQDMNAFIAYTEFYPFVQSVCYALREKSYQSELASRLTYFLDHSEETIEKLTASIDIQQQLNRQIHRQQTTQETILRNAMELKQLARANMDKTQDILTSVIQAARHEYDLLKQICSLSQTIQTVVRITCTYSFWFYILSMFAIYMMTIPKRTSRARSILFFGMFIYVLIERYGQMSALMNLYQWRLLCWTCCLIVLIRCAMKYQSRAKIDHEQLSKITADLIQTEATFARVSRELYRARARSKSRSRSRSARSRRATKTQETCVSPLTKETRLESLPLAIYEENKENHDYNHLIDDEKDDERISSIQKTKRHYSVVLTRAKKQSRKLLGTQNLENIMNRNVHSNY